MKEKKYILLCNLVSTYKDLSKIFNELSDTLGSCPENIGEACDRLVDMIMDALKIPEYNEFHTREHFVDEFYKFVDGNDVEDTIQHMLDIIEEI